MNIERTIFLIDEINTECAKEFFESMKFLIAEDPNKQIDIMLSSEGGNQDVAFAMYEFLKTIKTPFSITAMGLPASCSCLLFVAAPLNKRFITKNSMLLYHAGTTTLTGNVNTLRQHASDYEMLENKFDKIFSDNTGLSVKEVKELYNGQKGLSIDRFISPEEAIKFGIASKII